MYLSIIAAVNKKTLSSARSWCLDSYGTSRSLCRISRSGLRFRSRYGNENIYVVWKKRQKHLKIEIETDGRKN